MQCAECGLNRIETTDLLPDGHRDLVLYRKWGTIALVDSEPDCIDESHVRKN
jgi:hypothetical protein